MQQKQFLQLKYFIIVPVFYLVRFSLLAQSQVVLFYNANWEITQKVKHIFYRECEYDLNNFVLQGIVKDYYLSGKVLMTGKYNEGKKYGNFTFYYTNGEVESSGEYNNNSRVGKWKYFYKNGKLKMNVVFENPANNLDFSILEYYDSLGNQKIKNGNGNWINESIKIGLFDRNSPKTLTGRFKNGKKHGEWKLTRNSDKKLWHVEKFNNGVFMGADIYNEHGDYYGTMKSEILNKFPDGYSQKFKNTESFKLDSTSYEKSLVYEDVETIFKTVTGIEHKIQNRKAGYPYGDLNLLEYLSNNILYPVSALRARVQGTVFVNVIINKEGLTNEVTVLRGINSDLDIEAVRVIKEIIRWLPELKEGKPVISTITIPVKFQIKD